MMIKLIAIPFMVVAEVDILDYRRLAFGGGGGRWGDEIGWRIGYR